MNDGGAEEAITRDPAWFIQKRQGEISAKLAAIEAGLGGMQETLREMKTFMERMVRLEEREAEQARRNQWMHKRIDGIESEMDQINIRMDRADTMRKIAVWAISVAIMVAVALIPVLARSGYGKQQDKVEIRAQSGE